MGLRLKNQLLLLQDSAARVITKGNDADNLLAQLGFLNVQQLVDVDTAVMVYTGSEDGPQSQHNARCPAFPMHHNLKTGLRIAFPLRHITFCIRCKSSELLLLLVEKQIVAPRNNYK